MKPITQETLEILLDLIDNKEKVNAVIVVRSKSSGIDVTFKLSAFPDPDRKFYQDYRILMGYESGYNSYVNCCFIDIIGKIQYYTKYKNHPTVIIKSAYWLLDHIYNRKFDHLFEQAELYHTGKCLKCGRELTDAHSIELGIGPVCRGIN